MSRLRFIIVILLLSVFSVALIAETSFAISRKTLSKRIKNSQKYFEEVIDDPDTAIPTSIIEKASGIIILRQLKIGVVIGVKSGAGIAMAKNEKTQQWSPPAFVKTAEGSFGFQVGGKTINSIYVVMSKESMEKIFKSEVKLGMDISTQVGPMGKDIKVDLRKAPEVFVYSKGKGVYAGAIFKVGALTDDKEANRIFYRKKVSAVDILFHKAVKMPEEAKPFVKLLKSY